MEYRCAGIVDAVDELPAFVGDSECLKRFIEVYKSLPELWNKVHPSYMNKYKKQTALEKLLVIYREIKPRATVKDVTKKLNTLRSNYRREQNRIKSSLRSGAGTDEVYKPTSWVFYALKFLEDLANPASLTNPKEKPEKSQNQGESYSNSLSPGKTSCPASTSYPWPPIKKQKVQGPVAKPNELLKVACDYLSNSASQDDEYLTIAKVWANKLKALEPLQKKLAEKAINDVLFEADMQTLHRDSVKINITSSSPILSLLGSSSASSTLISPEVENKSNFENIYIKKEPIYEELIEPSLENDRNYKMDEDLRREITEDGDNNFENENNSAIFQKHFMLSSEDTPKTL